MTRDLAHDLIDRLAADLEPVRPIAPLGVTLAVVLASAALVGGVVLSFYDLHAELWTTFMHDRTYGGVLVGLGLAVLGGCLAALASVVPGREAVLRGGAGLVFGGLLLAVGVAAATTRWAEASFPAASAGHLMCIVRGVGFGLGSRCRIPRSDQRYRESGARGSWVRRVCGNARVGTAGFVCRAGRRR